MLRELYIKNFALISELRIDFESGLNIITGETGSGKSIMIDALSLCLGGRGDKGFIKHGEKKAVVEAVFYTNNKEAIRILEDNDIDFEDEIIISRELGEDGRSVARINSRNVNLSLVKEVAKYLLNIHGQNDYNYLYDNTNQLKLIDSFGGKQTYDLFKLYEKEYIKYEAIVEKIKELKVDKSSLEIAREKDFLEFVIKEIDEINIKEGEFEKLEQQLSILKNSEKIFTSVDNGYNYLYSAEGNVLSNLDKSIKCLESIKNYYPDGEVWRVSLQEAYYQIEDITRDMSSIKEKLIYDEEELDSIHERINNINNIVRKYGGSYEKLVAEYQKASNRLEEIQNSDEIKVKMNSILIEQEANVKIAGIKLRETRQAAAESIKDAIIKELDSLSMPKVQFVVDFKEGPINPSGIDTIEFLISFNKGEEPKTMAKIASGGETSRFMLSLKSVISKYDSIDSLLFDEIDTGVSGLAAENIGKKLKEIGKIRQVICITHLPQIASCAKTHFKVEKHENENNTLTTIKVLENEERQLELAKMMSGSNITELSLKNAKELLELNQG